MDADNNRTLISFQTPLFFTPTRTRAPAADFHRSSKFYFILMLLLMLLYVYVSIVIGNNLMLLNLKRNLDFAMRTSKRVSRNLAIKRTKSDHNQIEMANVIYCTAYLFTCLISFDDNNKSSTHT